LSVAGGSNFNAVMAWLFLVILIMMHVSAIKNGGKFKLLLNIYYVFAFIWFFGMIISFYVVDPTK